jgi:hypothetical protein
MEIAVGVADRLCWSVLFIEVGRKLRLCDRAVTESSTTAGRVQSVMVGRMPSNTVDMYGKFRRSRRQSLSKGAIPTEYV